MEIYNYSNLSKKKIKSLCQRNSVTDLGINKTVKEILNKVKEEGDKALLAYSLKYDKAENPKLFIDKMAMEGLAVSVKEEQKAAIHTAIDNISKFHQAQLKAEEKVETMPGVVCWREARSIDRVGLYVPGGSAVLPSTFLMLAIPAKIAGCKEIVVCSPPQQNGSINGYLAYCALALGVDRIYTIGGAQAIAAMAYGTETVPKVDKVFGPGNRFVTNAKNMLQGKGQISIDMPAGPSEVLVIGEEGSNPTFIAADLLSQAEHGADSQAVFVSTCSDLIYKVNLEIQDQLLKLDRNEIAEKALENSFMLKVSSLEEALEFSNIYAPEHLILSLKKYEHLLPLISNAGSVFLGPFTPEAAGDYASGTNHTLPTSGYAKTYSGVSVDSFMKKITFQEINQEGIKNLGGAIEILAEMEGLQAHKNAVRVRLKK
jgi:histidinol dehydrogenase